MMMMLGRTQSLLVWVSFEEDEGWWRQSGINYQYGHIKKNYHNGYFFKKITKMNKSYFDIPFHNEKIVYQNTILLLICLKLFFLKKLKMYVKIRFQFFFLMKSCNFFSDKIVFKYMIFKIIKKY